MNHLSKLGSAPPRTVVIGLKKCKLAMSVFFPLWMNPAAEVCVSLWQLRVCSCVLTVKATWVAGLKMIADPSC